jgi:hypothetical protein
MAQRMQKAEGLKLTKHQRSAQQAFWRGGAFVKRSTTR